jgi:DNA primase
VITFLQKIDGLTFPEALQILADRAGIELKQQTLADQQEKDEKSQLYRLNSAVAAFFHHTLTKTDAGLPAREYLSGRKVLPATIETFQIGYAPQNSGLVPWLTKQGFKPVDLDHAGHPERFRARVMFPIRDPLGHVLGFTGRLIDAQQDAPKYLNTPETPIFKKSKAVYGLYEGKEAIRHYQVAILMEGQMDVVLSHQVGAKLAVASSGTALTAEHLKILRRYAPKILLAFDSDQAGQTATEKAMTLAAAAELTIKVITMPNGLKDAGEVIERDPALWKQVIGQAISGMDWLVQSMVKKFGLADGGSKKLIARSVLPHVRDILDPVERAHAINTLARTLGVPERAISDTLERLAVPRSSNASAEQAPPAVKPVTRPIVERLLGLLLLHPELMETLQPASTHISTGTFVERLFKAMIGCYTPTEKQPPANFFASVQAALGREDQANVAALVMETEQWLTQELDAGQVGQELLQRLHQGEREDVKRSMAARIAAAEASGDRAQVKQLMTELQTILKPLNAKT